MSVMNIRVRITCESVPPSASIASRMISSARRVLDVLRFLPDLEDIRAARARHEPVRRAGSSGRDPGHRIALADDVGVDRRGHEHLLTVEAAAVPPVLARAAAVGLVVAPEL